ncbi:hypothetical protein [Arenimonas sp. MALMAid1274]|uniref:hypothetical protein n=1 Tax=Arenimonas sp. MALMAid1274 TaxID=3411630 RepID=UPI003BA2FCA0
MSRHALPCAALVLSLASLGGCGQSDRVEIANNDGAGLVAALRLANERPGPDTIVLARNGFYILSQEAQEGLLLPSLKGELTIVGNHAEIRGYMATPAALLQVEEGAEVRIENLVLAEGTDGALRNFGDLHLANVDLVDSSVRRLPAIVLNHGSLTATGGEIAYNHVLGVRRDAGTVLNYGQMRLEQTHIHDNRTLGRHPTLAAAGGILNFGSVEADGLTLQDNELPDEPVPALSFGGILNLGNGRFSGTNSSGPVRDARHATAFAGL